MKKYYLILLILTGVANAQIVNIPDANFKTALLAQDVDTNGDGQIQVSEAQAKTGLNVSASNIVNLTGIAAFVNLTYLNCAENDISTLDLTALTVLETFYGMSNPLTSLNITGLASLSSVDLNHCDLTSIDLAGCTALGALDLSYNQLTTLDASSAVNLTFLNVLQNFNLQSLNLAGVVNLAMLYATSTGLTTFDMSGNTSLVTLHLSSNALGAVDVSGCTALSELYINYSSMTSLNVAGCSSLQQLQVTGIVNLTALDISNLPELLHADVSSSDLITLNVSGCPELMTLNASNCELTSIDVSGCSSLNSLEVPYNELTTLDVSTCTSLTGLTLDGNPFETLFLKNGRNEFISAEVSPLVYICGDESQLTLLASQFSALPNVVINSYCSFTPGGDYNTITGTVSFDANNNGADASDPVFPHTKVTISGPAGDGATFTDANGLYTFYTQAGNYAVMPEIENENFFNLFSPVVVNFPAVNNSVTTQNFSVVANGVHPDVEVVIVPLIPSQPGFDALYKIVYKNKGNQLLSGHVFFEFENVYMDYVSAVPPPDNMLTGYLGFEYDNLMPFENREIIVTLNINAPTDTQPVNIGDELNFMANAIIDQGSDQVPGDNQFFYDETVVGSYDPNNKLCSEGGVVGPDKIGGYLHYVINFENTGTAAAQNIVVRDAINPLQFDVSSVQIINASHPVVARQHGNILECVFEGINLDSGGHGNILLKIKTLSILNAGDQVSNQADIFFDYNFPIETNNSVTSFESLQIGQHQGNLLLTAYPNPVIDILTLKAADVIQKVELYDIQGRLLQSTLSDKIQTQIDMSNRRSGIYIVKAIAARGSSVLKFIKN